MNFRYYQFPQYGQRLQFAHRIYTILTQSMNGTEAHQTDCVVLEIIISPSVALSGQFSALPEAADHEERQQWKSKDAGHDWDHNRFGGD